jgi:hypothetical protein
MKTWTTIGVGTCSCLMIGFLTHAQSAGGIRDQLIGTWVLVANSDKNSDGMPKWGENPKGSLIFEANGRYSFIIVRSDLPKFAANSPDKGTPEEMQMLSAEALRSSARSQLMKRRGLSPLISRGVSIRIYSGDPRQER